jgi:hypothetical protein
MGHDYQRDTRETPLLGFVVMGLDGCDFVIFLGGG